MKNLLFAIAAMLLVGTAQAQELVCNVKINADQVQTQERQIFADMEAAIQQFMNTTKWTDMDFQEHEKIKCDMLITLDKGNSITQFGAKVQIKSMRPVYGTSYDTPVLNFFDNNWRFTYNISQPLIFSENTYTSELTSLLAFHAYMVIGFDFDTFSPKGGSPYFERALNIVNNSQNSGGPGWKSVGSDVRDRYWLSENMNSPQFEDFRLALYEYHRMAIDVLIENPDQARDNILQQLYRIKKVREVQPTSVTINAFFDAKSFELANLYSRGDADIRQQAIDILLSLDPTNSNVYRKAIRE